MKSLDGQKSNNDDKKESAEGKATEAAPAPVVEEKIDFSNVVIEPMFEEPKNSHI